MQVLSSNAEATSFTVSTASGNKAFTYICLGLPSCTVISLTKGEMKLYAVHIFWEITAFKDKQKKYFEVEFVASFHYQEKFFPAYNILFYLFPGIKSEAVSMAPYTIT